MTASSASYDLKAGLRLNGSAPSSCATEPAEADAKVGQKRNSSKMPASGANGVDIGKCRRVEPHVALSIS